MSAKNITLDYKTGVIRIDGIDYARACKTSRGWRWSCINGRSSRRIDFHTLIDALSAACKALRITNPDQIVYPEAI